MNPSNPVKSTFSPTFSSAPLSSAPSGHSWQRLQSVAIALLGWIPSGLGASLRHKVYRKFFEKLGAGAQIAKNVQFCRMENIALADEVAIESDSSVISSWEGDGKIILNAAVSLHQGVRLHAHGDQAELLLQNRVTIERGVDIKTCENGCVKICRETTIGAYTCIAGPGNIHIGEYCMIASHCGIYANQHIFADRTVPIMLQGVTTQGIVIENDCWLGTGVKVLDGVRIGRGSVIGAGAVVTTDIPPYSVAVGVPARVIKSRG
jgi:acetyltransferase-like isoleucine patch superfamily enzyme